jgi:hypothetical protein
MNVKQLQKALLDAKTVGERNALLEQFFRDTITVLYPYNRS